MISKKSKPFYYSIKEYPYNNEEKPYEVDLFPGKYYIECVGAGGGWSSTSGFGAKVSGYVKISKIMKAFLYVGGKGEEAKKSRMKAKGGFNGGGSGGAGATDGHYGGGAGGGATDLRLIKGFSWNETESLKSRVIVAAGGAGASFQTAGNGGTLEGSSSSGSSNVCSLSKNIFKGGSQSDGYAFGYGMDGADGVEGGCGCEGNGGGGGGWYGGFASNKTGTNSNASGGGGSSYISGLIGCLLNNEFVFTQTYMEDGSVTKNKGNGYALIARISPASMCRKYCSSSTIFIYLLVSCLNS